MALRESTIERIDDALRVVDEIEKEQKEKFCKIGIVWTGYGDAMNTVFEQAAKITHYSVQTLRRYRNERRAKKGRFSRIK